MNSLVKNTVHTLNDLIAVLKDGQRGYKTASEDVKAPELARILARYAKQRAEFVVELQAHVNALGEDPEKSGSVTGSLHRGWINLKAALSSNDPHAVLVEAERGEDVALSAYRKALEDHDLDESSREVIGLQYTEVRAAFNHIRMLRDSGTYKKTF